MGVLGSSLIFSSERVGTLYEVVSVCRQRIAELEQRLEKMTEENEKLSEHVERREMQVTIRLYSFPKYFGFCYLLGRVLFCR